MDGALKKRERYWLLFEFMLQLKAALLNITAGKLEELADGSNQTPLERFDESDSVPIRLKWSLSSGGL